MLEERWIYIGMGCCDLVALSFFAVSMSLFVAGRSTVYDNLEILESADCIERNEFLDSGESMAVIYNSGIALLTILSLWLCSDGLKVISWDNDYGNKECLWVGCFSLGYFLIHGLAVGIFTEYLILKRYFNTYLDPHNTGCDEQSPVIDSLESFADEGWIYHTVGLSCMWFNLLLLFLCLCTPCREEQSQRTLGNPFRILHDRALLCRIQVVSILWNPRAFCARRCCCCFGLCWVRCVGPYIRMRECCRWVFWCFQPAPEQEPAIPESTFIIGFCPLCLEDSKTLVATRGCEHNACKECLVSYLAANLKNVESYPRVCFHMDCDGLLHYADVYHILEPEMLREYDRMQAVAALPPQDRVTCPVCFTISAVGSNRRVRCANTRCNIEFCSWCQVIWHRNETCEQYQSRILNKNWQNEEKFLLMVKAEKWQKCPNCGAMIEKTEGCNHMIHKACTGSATGRTDFCYCCSQRLTGDGHRYEEGTNPLVLHFLNGVFQDCRNMLPDAEEVKGIIID